MANKPKNKRVYKPSPFGPVLFPWLNKPDTKFNENGVYKADLALTGAPAEKFAEEIDAEAQAAFDEITADMTPGERKKWKLYVPYRREEDDEGNPTGRIIFQFRQNATIQVKGEDTPTEVKIGIYDSDDKDLHKPVFSGSVIRVLYATRQIKMQSAKEAGVRLDFSMVQVKELAKARGGGSRFGKVEGGYRQVDDEDDAVTAERDDATDAAGGDY